MSRVADYSQHKLSLAFMMRTQSRIADTHIQIASGKQAQSYSGIPVEAHQLVSLERDVAHADQFIANINRAVGRLDIMESAVGTIVTRATEVLGILSEALSGNNIQLLPLERFAESFSGEVASLLNTRHEDRFLFAGSRTATQPVDLTDPDWDPQASLPGGPFTADTGYYQGDGIVQTVRADEAYELDYGITADAGPFEELLRAFEYMAYAGANQDKAVLAEAYTLVNGAIDGLSAIRGQIGATSSVLEKAKGGHENYLAYAKNLISAIEDVDVAEATTRLASDQVQLQGSYMALSRIKSLSLVDFLG